jgi:hypothetical protein
MENSIEKILADMAENNLQVEKQKELIKKLRNSIDECYDIIVGYEKINALLTFQIKNNERSAAI